MKNMLMALMFILLAMSAWITVPILGYILGFGLGLLVLSTMIEMWNEE